MKVLYRLAMALVVSVLLLSLLLFIELAGAAPHFELEPATIRKVVPNPPWHYVGQSEMTLVRFADGLPGEMPGNCGDPGERILAPRQRGIDTPFGWLSHR